MRPSVAAAWPTVAREHEGALPFMYLDTVGKVTAGIGTLLDTGTGTAPEACLALPWVTAARPATRAEIAAAWQTVKSRQDLQARGGRAFELITTLRLDSRTIDRLLLTETAKSWAVLAARLPGLERWPADAQLALVDMAYQLGPRFMGPKWPNFTAAAEAGDFNGCALHCSVKQANAERNTHRMRLFTNAERVVELGIDPAILWDTKRPEETMATERLTPPYPVGIGRTCIDVLRALPLVEYRFKKAGWIQDDFSGLVSQWGYQNNAVDASSTTHNRGGVFDVDYTLVNTDAKLIVWQECGFKPFRRRPPQWSLSKHGHILVECDHLDPLADAQVTDYHNGRNGLASHAAYDGPIRADRSWQRAQEIYADLLEEMELMDAGTQREIANATAAAVAARLGSDDEFKTKVAMAARNLVLGINDDGLGDVIPSWHTEGGDKWRLNELLRDTRLTLEAIVHELSQQGIVLGRLAAAQGGQPAAQADE